MVAKFERVESRFATVPQSGGPFTCAGLQVVTQSTHDFQGIFRPVDIEPPNLDLEIRLKTVTLTTT